MPEQQQVVTIPPGFDDYTRRLIIWSLHHTGPEFDIQLTRVISDLESREFFPAEQRFTFAVGSLQVGAILLLNERLTVDEAVQFINDNPNYPHLRAEADSRIALLAPAVNDPLYRHQWALLKIEAEAAWARVAEVSAVSARPSVTVAIIDSGIKRDHEDLDASAISGVSIINSNDPTNFFDRDGHGTMLAGTIAAISGNHYGIAGEAPNVSLFACQFNDVQVPGTALAAVLGIRASLLAGAKIINASWHVIEDSGSLKQAILQAAAQGCVFVAAAGNYGSNNNETPTLPASYGLNNMIVAMASDRHDTKCWFSNYGPTVDIAAPGDGILTTGLYFAHPAYREYSGTSASAAHVVGAAALLFAIDDWTPAEIRAHLVASAVKRRGLRKTCHAEGRLNLRRAVLGPFSITKPAAGETVAAGSSYLVEWNTDYVAPVVNSVEVSIIDHSSGSVLSTLGGLNDDGQALIAIPNTITKAIVKVRCEQKNLYALSGIFQVA